ncbi:MAG: radical SAM protein [Thermoplasmatales archaeon]|nr:radical SAM protein [Thermoplasmatales archaeon]
MKYRKVLNKEEVIFLVYDIIEVRIDRKVYERDSRKYKDEDIIRLCPFKEVYNAVTKRKLYFISEESGIPLIGYTSFGLIDRDTNIIQVRPVSGCNLNCIYCSVDEGKSRTRFVDYMVDVDYLLREFEEIVKMKRKKCNSIEAHIDGQGEPFLYPYIEELIKGLKEIADIVSIQTNGVLLNKEKIRRLEGHLDRINLSINALDKNLAEKIAGCKYNVEHVMKVAEEIASSSIDLLLAPVWLINYNDEEVLKIIEFGKRIGAGKRWKPFGIQKYIRHKFGRKPKGIKVIDFKRFYEEIEKIDKSLHLYPVDFGIVKCRVLPKKFKVGEKFKFKLEMEGRMKNEMLSFARDRVVSIYTNKKIGEFVDARIVKNKHNIYIAKEL